MTVSVNAQSKRSAPAHEEASVSQKSQESDLQVQRQQRAYAFKVRNGYTQEMSSSQYGNASQTLNQEFRVAQHDLTVTDENISRPNKTRGELELYKP